jgi:hypothetical protein
MKINYNTKTWRHSKIQTPILLKIQEKLKQEIQFDESWKLRKDYGRTLEVGGTRYYVVYEYRDPEAGDDFVVIKRLNITK